MLYLIFSNSYILYLLDILGVAFAFAFTIWLLKTFKDRLPQDQGRIYAVEGALSKGKARGAGLFLVFSFVLCNLLFDIISIEKTIYLLVIGLSMYSGYLDDASEKPWSEYVKGAIDLVLAVVVAVTYLYFNGNSFEITYDKTITIPYWLYGLLIVVLVWVAINVTNCTDGVDGLCGTLSIITLGAFYVLVSNIEGIDDFSYAIVIFIVVILAYLWYNSTPSTILMGDAGSRAIGLMIAISALKCRMPQLYIPLSIVMILDGGLGLLKVALLRFLKIGILKNVRCPLHDQARKVNNWSNTQVCYRFAIIQIIVCIITIWAVWATFWISVEFGY